MAFWGYASEFQAQRWQARSPCSMSANGFQEYFFCIKCELKFGGLADLVCPHSHKHRSSSMDNWIPGCRTGCFSFVT